MVVYSVYSISLRDQLYYKNHYTCLSQKDFIELKLVETGTKIGNNWSNYMVHTSI